MCIIVFRSMRFQALGTYLTTMSKVLIGTHSGCFHCDEALACFMLRQLPEYANAEIVRSRDEKVLDGCDIVVDVGSKYDPSKHRYDHHQITFSETMKTLRPNMTSDIRLSSAGLVYHHFGERILQSVYGSKLDQTVLEKLFVYVYDSFIKEIDAIDNGVPMFDAEPRYKIKTDVSSRIQKLFPPWNAKVNISNDELFEKAMQLVGGEFIENISIFRDVLWPARVLVEEAVDNRFKTHESGLLIEVEPCPWKDHLFSIEKDHSLEGVLKFCIMKDDSWRVIAVPVAQGSFVLRIPLLESLRGLRNEELAAVSGVPDAIFVHQNGFIGGAQSREGVIKLAQLTIDAVHKNGNEV